MPELTDIDEFYLDMFICCRDKVLSVVDYCGLYRLTNEETLEAARLMQKINAVVNKDANS